MLPHRHPSTPTTTPEVAPPVDPRFVVDFRPLEDPGPGQRWSTWLDVDPLCRGPEPRPPWVVTTRAALDTELGVLKTGKEADVHLVERGPRDPRDGPSVVMAAKRYRDAAHRDFHRNAAYVEGRRHRDSREARAAARGTAFGRQVAAGTWAAAEWDSLVRCWEAGLPVPYPVQLDGTELLMEWVEHDGETAPRLAQARPEDPALLRDWFEQLREVLASLAQHGLVHGDLSAYNVLVRGDRLVVIDLPQVLDLVGHPQGTAYLQRDCANVCAWFRARGLDAVVADPEALLADVLASAF